MKKQPIALETTSNYTWITPEPKYFWVKAIIILILVIVFDIVFYIKLLI